MREIKFRAWDKGKRIMSFAPFGIEDIDGLERLLGSVRIMVSQSRIDHLVLMQYTGLTDKNGKEIYEGDVGLHLVGEWGTLILLRI
ncbi:MAG: YopX family protein [Reyranella sp.]